MPHRILRRPRLGTLAARLLLAAGLIAGLLGMHVMMTPGAHSAHASPPAATASSMSSHGGAAEPQPVTAARQAPCAPSGCADVPPARDAGVWAVVCVLALLLTAVLAGRRPLGYRRAPRRAPMQAGAGRVTADQGARHPPSLIVLSISRT